MSAPLITDFVAVCHNEPRGDFGLEAHARRIFALGQTLQSQAAGELARRIEAGALDGADSFTARDIYRKQWHLLNDAEIVGDALNELVDAGWLLRDTQAAGWQQRGCQRYRVNPRARQAVSPMPRA